ncbi:hypothetical protein GEMRC1_013058 [Eukaryota sp. GEM-RC1]
MSEHEPPLKKRSISTHSTYITLNNIVFYDKQIDDFELTLIDVLVAPIRKRDAAKISQFLNDSYPLSLFPCLKRFKSTPNSLYVLIGPLSSFTHQSPLPQLEDNLPTELSLSDLSHCLPLLSSLQLAFPFFYC